MLGSNPNKKGGGLNIGGRGWKLGGIGWRGQVQGGVGDTLMITKGADKFPSDPIFYLFECYFSSGDVRQVTSSVRHPDLYKKSGSPSYSLVLLASSSVHSCLD